MKMANLLGNVIDLVEGFPTVDLQTGANNGDWVSLIVAERCMIVFSSGIGTAGDDATLTLEQATDASGTGAKALNPVTDPPHCWKKQAASDLSSTAVWTDAAADVTTNTFTNIDAAEQSCLWVVEISAIQLDVNNSFTHLRATVADIGSNAQPGSLLYILSGLRNQENPTTLTSPIA
jgi:hypothetical protein